MRPVRPADASMQERVSKIDSGFCRLLLDEIHVVWALEHLAPEPRAELVSLLEAKATDAADLARAVELIDLGGGIEMCRDLARKLADEAQERARQLTECGTITEKAADLLISMADFFINRRA